jgi:threonyl-tRNA synthetase
MQLINQIIAAEALAISVCELFAGAQLVYSEVTEATFSYDFIISQLLAVDDHLIALIEEKMRAIIKAGRSIQLLDMMRENGAELLASRHQPIKAMQVSLFPQNIVQIVKIENFYDFIPSERELVLGESTLLAGEVKIFSIQQVTQYVENFGELAVVRIEGAAADNRQYLKQFSKRYAATKLFDHKILGEEMKLFSYQVIENSVFWHQKGVLLQDSLINYWKELIKQKGFYEIRTPPMIRSSLIKHKRDENSHFKVEVAGEEHSVFPRKNILHTYLAASQTDVYQNWPLRLAEFAEKVDSNKSSLKSGLFQSPICTGDDFTIYCSPSDVVPELISCLQLFEKTVKILGFESRCFLVTARSRHSSGSMKDWESSTHWLAQALEQSALASCLDDNSVANEGPRIEVRIKDRLGRQWTGPWIGIDWLIPKLLRSLPQLKDPKKYPLVVINGAFYGSLQRIIALLLEQYRGVLPLWLAPEQVRVLVVGKSNINYAGTVQARVKEAGFRVEADLSETALSSKVHAAEKEKIPYIVIIGEKERKEEAITARFCNQEKTVSQSIKLDFFLNQLKADLKIGE